MTAKPRSGLYVAVKLSTLFILAILFSAQTSCATSERKSEPESAVSSHSLAENKPDTKKPTSADQDKKSSSKSSPTAPAMKSKKTKSKPSENALTTIEKRYSGAKSVKMKVKKDVVLAQIGKKKTYLGTLLIKPKGKFKFDITEPTHSMVLVDGKQVWVVDYPSDPSVENVTRVLTSKDTKKMQSPVLVTFLLGKGSLLDHFNIIKEASNGSKVTFDLKPKAIDGDVTHMAVVVDSALQLIDSIEYTDQLENKSRFEFSETTFDEKVADSQFKFKPPKGAEVTEQ